nr:hypothetical protein B296_00042377 [Ipomoea batatas]
MQVMINRQKTKPYKQLKDKKMPPYSNLRFHSFVDHDKATSRGSFLISGSRVLHHAPHSPGDHAAHQHRPPAVVSAVGAVVGAAAAGGGADPGHLVALEAVAYDGADAAAGERAAQAGRATRPQRARERGAVKPEQLVPVGGAPRVLLAGGVGAYLHGVPAVLEPLDRALRVVDLQYPFDLANRVVLL